MIVMQERRWECDLGVQWTVERMLVVVWGVNGWGACGVEEVTVC